MNTPTTQQNNTAAPPPPAQTPPMAPPASTSLVTKFAERLGVEPNRMLSTLKATCFKQKDGDPEITNEQMMALLIVSDQYHLNPFTREIFAFPDKKGIVPVVSVDGWSRIINEHPSMDGVNFRYADEMRKMDDNAKECPIWCEVIIKRKDRAEPIVVREYLDECYRPAFEGKKNGGGTYTVLGAWQSHTKRFLRHKTLIQGARVAFGFAGIYDEDEAVRITDVTPPPTSQEKEKAKSTLNALNNNPPPEGEGKKVIDAEIITETPPAGAETKAENESLQSDPPCPKCAGRGIVESADGKEPCDCEAAK